MRSNDRRATAAEGVSLTCALFERLGWAPQRNDAHDLGTDLWVEVADRRRFMPGLIIGVQVKAGPYWFRRKQHTPDGDVEGWWYYEPNNNHFDHWSSHGVPHLVVLCDLCERVAYWVHVTPDAVKSVGKGSKILVPEHQRIHAGCFDALLATAAKQNAAPKLEGTVLWTGEGAVAADRRLRCALIAPRLLAPHPNAGHDEAIDASAGVALAAQGRFRDLKRFSEQHSSVPDLENPTPGCDWIWLLMAAIWQWASARSVEPLRSVFKSAPDARGAVASGVLLACALRQLEQPEDALEVLNGLIDGVELQPVDYGWVLVQRSRTRAEIGNISGARADASEALRDFSASADDVTVSPLAAAAAWQLFMTARGSQPAAAITEQDQAGGDLDPADTHRGFAEMIAASDTAVSWWRSQMIAAALHQAENPTFERWAEVYPVRLFHTGDPWSPELFAAELSADVAADQSRWCDLSALRARQQLMRAPECGDETAELVEGLDTLRRSGDHQSLRRAVGHLHQVGPLEAVADAVGKIPLDGWTHTSACTNFEMLAHAGDLLDEPTASQLIAWSLDLADGYPADFIRRVRPDFQRPVVCAASGQGPARRGVTPSALRDRPVHHGAEPGASRSESGASRCRRVPLLRTTRRLRARGSVGVRATRPGPAGSGGARLAGLQRQHPGPIRVGRPRRLRRPLRPRCHRRHELARQHRRRPADRHARDPHSAHRRCSPQRRVHPRQLRRDLGPVELVLPGHRALGPGDRAAVRAAGDRRRQAQRVLANRRSASTAASSGTGNPRWETSRR